ncbi:MAG: hypothetical protein KUG78_04130 [Kangiellaceae bacterium]|nr:hypothetical protein [Kangiellaceae bacterium]
MNSIKRKFLTCFLFSLTLLSFEQSIARQQDTASKSIDPFWNNAIVYFMMTDRFSNGDTSNDQSFGRKPDGGVLRNFMGGDLKGVTQKIEEGYFDALGVEVIWMTPVNEQIHGYWQDEWGRSYPFHGYWIKDWTAVDPNFGTENDLRNMIQTAHEHGIRVLADVIINHTGPKTNVDGPWPSDWIRTQPTCQWHSYQENVKCALATSITDIRTESDTPVELPKFLIEKWRKEGRLEQETNELDAFFERTNLARSPKNYVVKWLTDWVRDYGIDGFRVDTAKHVEAEIWQVLKEEASTAFKQWQSKNPDAFEEDKDFFMIGEVMHFGVDGFKNTPKGTRLYDYGDNKVDFFNFGFDSLINMGFATHANGSMEDIFSTYSKELNQGPLKGVGILNYIVSHDDPEPYDKEHQHSYKAALKLMLAPGAAQIYYGDEIARNLIVKGATGDATWRSFMNWKDLKNKETQDLLTHWKKLGQFRKEHLSVGAGVHKMHNEKPYIFSRTLASDQRNNSESKSESKSQQDRVLVGLGLNKGKKTLSAYGIFRNGEILQDYYSNTIVTVKKGKVSLNSEYKIVLLGLASQ